FTNGSFLINSGSLISCPLYSSKMEVRSLLIALLQALMLSTLIGFFFLWERNFSKNIRIEVLSDNCEFTFPPRLQGEATTKGIRYPIPIGLLRPGSFGFPFKFFTSVLVTYSTEGSIPSEQKPELLSSGSGAVKGGM